MSSLKFHPEYDAPERDALDPFPFPGDGARPARTEPMRETPGMHAAEIALERAQRRLDNLRDMLGPGFGREEESGPRAA